MAAGRGAWLACMAWLLSACSALDLGNYEVTCVEEEVCNGLDDDCDGEVDEGLDWRAVDVRERTPARQVEGSVLHLDRLALDDRRALVAITRGTRAGDYATEALLYAGAEELHPEVVSIYDAAKQPPLAVESREHACGYREDKLAAVANARAGSLLMRAALGTTGCRDGQLLLGATHLDEGDPLVEVPPGDDMLPDGCAGDELLAPWLFVPASPDAARDEQACGAPGAPWVREPVLAALPLAQPHSATALAMWWRKSDGRLMDIGFAAGPRSDARGDWPPLQVEVLAGARELGYALAPPALVAWRGDTDAEDRFIAAYPSARESCPEQLEVRVIRPARDGEIPMASRRCLELPGQSEVALAIEASASVDDGLAPSRGLAAAWRAEGAAWFVPLVLDESKGDLEIAAEPIQLRSPGGRVVGTPAVAYRAEGFRSARDHETIGGWIVAWIEKGPPQRVMAQRIAQADAVPIGEPFELIVAEKGTSFDHLWLSPAGRDEAAALFGVLEAKGEQTLHIGTASCKDL